MYNVLHFQIYNSIDTFFITPSVMPQWWRSGLERSTRKRKVGCLNPSRDRPKSLKS